MFDVPVLPGVPCGPGGMIPLLLAAEFDVEGRMKE
jgi:hypothetical protein